MVFTRSASDTLKLLTSPLKNASPSSLRRGSSGKSLLRAILRSQATSVLALCAIRPYSLNTPFNSPTCPSYLPSKGEIANSRNRPVLSLLLCLKRPPFNPFLNPPPTRALVTNIGVLCSWLFLLLRINAHFL